MANSYTQIYVHAVFAVRNREGIIPQKHKLELQKYTGGILRQRGHIPIAINFMKDHVHLLFGLNINETISVIIRELKRATSEFINVKGWIAGHFQWQTGYGAFGCSKRELPIITKYINNQESHHKIKSFKDEFLEIMKDHEINYDPKYMFNWIPDANEPGDVNL